MKILKIYKDGVLELIKQASFSSCIRSRDLEAFLSFPLKSCKDEAPLITLKMAFHTMGPLYLIRYFYQAHCYTVLEK